MSKSDKPLEIVFVDDNDGFLEKCRTAFAKGCPKGYATVREIRTSEIKEAILALNKARYESRTRRKHGIADDSILNDADIVFVDYDLIELEDSTVLTGEDIAYLLRCFSTCGIIILLNPPDLGTDFFDLRLRRHLDSWADLQVGTDQLSDKWFWNEQPAGFSPWHWPQLRDAVWRRTRQVAEMRSALNKVMLDTIGFDGDVLGSLDHSMTDVVYLGTKPLHAADFVLSSDFGVHRKDRPAVKGSEDQLARIAAARVSSWLESVVLPAQNVIIDAPHLVARSPGLLAGNPDKIGSWNATATRCADGLAKVLKAPEVAAYRFKKDLWLSRPAWFWPLLANSERFMRWAELGTKKDFVFCEDTSDFAPRSDAHEFMADVPPSFALRYVRKVKGAGRPSIPTYRPAMRLSM